jgi:hypothetical protein
LPLYLPLWGEGYLIKYGLSGLVVRIKVLKINTFNKNKCFQEIIQRALKGTPGQIRLAEEDIVADFCIILQLRQPMGREL